MKPTSIALYLTLAAWGASSCASATSTTAAASASVPASAPLRATRAASAACAAPGASVPLRGHAVTSKVRHIPDEGDACSDSIGVAPPLSR